jgi:acetoin utilization deacetylase AcuC-like enzyme
MMLTAKQQRSSGLCCGVLSWSQGDGTASIFAEDPSVFTVSFHCAENFPFRKFPSDLDVPFPAGTGDAAFLPVFKSVVSSVLDKEAPELVLYDAGNNY